MSIISILMIGLGLAMDALAVSITIGINSNKKSKIKMAFKAALFFGAFQAIMPFIGWAVGRNFTKYIEMMDHWIAFILFGSTSMPFWLIMKPKSLPDRTPNVHLFGLRRRRNFLNC